jgi:hypothetical protein
LCVGFARLHGRAILVFILVLHFVKLSAGMIRRMEFRPLSHFSFVRKGSCNKSFKTIVSLRVFEYFIFGDYAIF